MVFRLLADLCLGLMDQAKSIILLLDSLCLAANTQLCLSSFPVVLVRPGLGFKDCS